MSEHPKQLELLDLYIELFGSHNVSDEQWNQTIHMACKNKDIQIKLTRVSDLTIDLLEIWFNDLCEQSVFPPDKCGKWTYLLPSYNGIDCLSYFETKDEASNAVFYCFQGQRPRVAFIGRIHNTFNI